jgi:hypothetical protein
MDRMVPWLSVDANFPIRGLDIGVAADHSVFYLGSAA